ncbi:uncharacterized protein LOC111337095 [Stylophora pistillata]|uniref:uncharacterized protein LOC111337095 n=1 Tax=Stylophora pistillata TaxID=50429 RepID=UPI000C05495F|nr:uncharacterized protein LOC111337095 [Stylophora pistillata]
MAYLSDLVSVTRHKPHTRRMRWKAYHFLNQKETADRETYGFKSRNSTPQVKDLIHFEEAMTKLIQNIKFKESKCNFQSQLNSDIKNKIKKPNTLLISADKTTNFYEMNPDSYGKLIKDNVTKTYRKASDNLVGKLDAQSARIAERLKLGDRVELAKKEAFITLKDHKLTFHDHPTCLLINPLKSEIGVISK